jgi:hypothetical protein
VAGNHVWVKNDGTYTLTAGVSFSQSLSSAQNFWIRGYTTTRGDGGRAQIVLSTNTGLTALTIASTGALLENFDVNCSSLGTSIGIAGGAVRNCKVYNFTTAGITIAALGNASYNEVTAGTSAAFYALRLGGNAGAYFNNIHDNVCPGISVGNFYGVIAFNLATNNSGASSDGIVVTSGTISVLFNTCYGNGRYGININSGAAPTMVVKGNMLAKNGTYGLASTGTGTAGSTWMIDGNAYYMNSSGMRTGFDSTSGVFADYAYTNALDATCTVDPFVNAASGLFRLNNTVNGGRLARRNALAAVFPGAASTERAFFDFGTLQSIPPLNNGK